MTWQDNPNNRKNPWDKGERGGNRSEDDNRGRNPWGSGGGGDMEPPDLDDMLRKAQANFRQVMPGQFGGGVAGLVFLVAALLWLASGLYIVNPGESAVIQRFGAWNRTQSSEGLGYRFPWPIEAINTVRVSEARRMEIGFTQSYGRGNAGSKQDVPEESLMLTSDANIVNLDLVVLWNIKSAEDYIFNIHDPENTIKKVAESAIREVIGQTPMFSIITQDRDVVAARAKEIMSANLDQYKSGINISSVLIQEAEVHPDVQEAFQDVQSAKQDAFDAQNRAEAYRQDIIPRARGEGIKMVQESQGYRQSVVSRATGDAERFNAVYEAYKSGPEVTRTRIYIEAMEDVYKNAQKIIMRDDGKGSGVVPYLPLNELRAPVKSDDDVKSSSSYESKKQ